MPTVLITGGTGLIGTALSELLLQKGYQVIILSRSVPGQQTKDIPGLLYARWDIAPQTIDATAIQKADYIVHLAGAGVAEKRWTSKRKKEIVNSRTQSSGLLLKAITETPNHIKAIISASAIGWYGPDPVRPDPRPFMENDPAAHDFLGETCRQWEQSIEPVTQLGKRLVILRTGIVLSTKGGALMEFIKPLRFGIAGILGNGKQVISWIHIDDLCRLYLRGIEDENMLGVYNAVAPSVLSNKTFTLQLARAVKHSFYIALYIPSVILKLVLGQMSVEVLKSATVSATKIKSAGFSFIYPTTEAAINQLTAK
jgi:uncharacterized protein (TIGR01777 family)